MGSTVFVCEKIAPKSTNPFNVFDDLRVEAMTEEGNEGYTGTIAEKHDFAPCPVQIDSEDALKTFFTNTLYHYEDDPEVYSEAFVNRICDKNSPAWFVRLHHSDTEDCFIFFGNARS